MCVCVCQLACSVDRSAARSVARRESSGARGCWISLVLDLQIACAFKKTSAILSGAEAIVVVPLYKRPASLELQFHLD